jgi:superfamily II DNA or RNA helicase
MSDRVLVPPFDIYLKTLILLNNLPDLQRKPDAKIPTYYQKGVVANAINQANEYGGGLILAATGLGKTTIGVEIALHLMLSKKVKRVVLIAPKGVMENWRKEFDNLDIFSRYFTINTLFLRSSSGKKSQARQLEQVLKTSDNETLIIIDEVHFLRNQLLSEQTKGKKSLVYKRLEPIVKVGAKIFLLTATVYGTNNQNLNSLLYLLPHRKKVSSNKFIPWEVKSADEFINLPVVTILGLPHVLKMARDRGDVDENGRTFIRMSNEVRYLPESIKLYSVRYDLFLQSELQHAFDNLYFDQASKVPNFRYDDDTQMLLEGVTDSSRKSAIESWLSSSLAILDSIEDNLLSLGKNDSLTSEDNADLSNNNNSSTLMHLNKRERQRILRPIAVKLVDLKEDKFHKLSDIIEEHCVARKSKVIVFVNRYRTAQHLLGALEEYFKGKVQIGCTVETREGILRLRQDRSETLEKFSPRSHSSTNDYLPDDEYNVLICTDADGVGVNLQDADTVINYDPPKSADILFQRAGRVLRMTTDPNRIVHLYMLVPSVIDSFDAQSAVCKNIKDIFDRIKYRHEKSKSILGSSVISENEYTEKRLDEEEIDVERLTRESDILKSIGGLWAESMLSHTAVLEQNRSRAEGLPDYMLSAKTCSESAPYMFVLIEFEEKHIPILYDLKHEYVERDETLKILDLISCTDSTIRENVEFSMVEHYANETVQAWCNAENIPVSSVRKICGLYLQPDEQAKDIKEFLKGN